MARTSIQSKRICMWSGIGLIAAVVGWWLSVRDPVERIALPYYGRALRLSFSPDSNRVLITGRDNTIVMRIADCQTEWQRSGNFSPIGQWFRDGERIVVGEAEKRTLLVLDGSTYSEIASHQVMPHLTGLAVDRDGISWSCWGAGYASDFSLNGTGELIDLEGERFKGGLPQKVGGCQSSAGWDVAVSEFDECNYLAAVSSEWIDCPPTLWRVNRGNVENPTKLASFAGIGKSRIALSAKWSRIAFLSTSGINIFSLDGTPIATDHIPSPSEPSDAMAYHGVAFSSVDPALAVSRRDWVEVRDAVDGQVRHRRRETCYALQFSPNGRFLAISTARGLILLKRPLNGWCPPK
jgi:hypothetical protein